MPPLNAKVVDTAPDKSALIPNDEQHAVAYARLLDAEADNADWREVARIVFRSIPHSIRTALAVLSTVI